MLAVPGWERAINTLSVRRPQSHNTSPYKKKYKGKTVGDRKHGIFGGPQCVVGLVINFLWTTSKNSVSVEFTRK